MHTVFEVRVHAALSPCGHAAQVLHGVWPVPVLYVEPDTQFVTCVHIDAYRPLLVGELLIWPGKNLQVPSFGFQ